MEEIMSYNPESAIAHLNNTIYLLHQLHDDAKVLHVSASNDGASVQLTEEDFDAFCESSGIDDCIVKVGSNDTMHCSVILHLGDSRVELITVKEFDLDFLIKARQQEEVF
tara:strand:+ start:5577 stop:5906 length:330 start_codon:yes stop_codon:yes gene_type:complete